MSLRESAEMRWECLNGMLNEKSFNIILYHRVWKFVYRSKDSKS